jgi:purine-nucleoside/S-methyl-5'-thioadenosine phosphorylase / adenosine deaminase
LIEHQHNTTRHLQFHHYQQFPELIHGIFTREGGYSPAPYHSLNTSTTLASAARGGDSIDNVARNRQLILRALGLGEYPCATLWQVHGAGVLAFDTRDEWRTDWASTSYYLLQSWTPAAIHKADAILSQQPGLAIALSFADCTPITFYDPMTRVAGIAHGGWRGTARGIVIATIEAMQQRFGCQPQHIYAGIGPTIGPCCYEVSPEIEALFLGHEQFDEMPIHEKYRALVHESAVFSIMHLSGQESLRLDLAATTYKQLIMAGLLPEHIEQAEICTGCNTDRFYSHRREQGRTGRFPVVMALRA